MSMSMASVLKPATEIPQHSMKIVMPARTLLGVRLPPLKKLLGKFAIARGSVHWRRMGTTPIMFAILPAGILRGQATFRRFTGNVPLTGHTILLTGLLAVTLRQQDTTALQAAFGPYLLR